MATYNLRINTEDGSVTLGPFQAVDFPKPGEIIELHVNYSNRNLTHPTGPKLTVMECDKGAGFVTAQYITN